MLPHLVNRNFYWDNLTHLVLCGSVVLLAERHDIYTLNMHKYSQSMCQNTMWSNENHISQEMNKICLYATVVLNLNQQYNYINICIAGYSDGDAMMLSIGAHLCT